MKNLTTRQRAPHTLQLLDDATLGHTGGGLGPIVTLGDLGGTTNVAINNSGPVYQAGTQNFYQCP